jgi:hypothetical protein
VKPEQAAPRSKPHAPRRADLVLQQARRARKDHVRRRRADDDEVDVVGRDAGLRDRPSAASFARSDVATPGIDDVALADAGALEDPLVVVSTIFSRSALVSRRGGT